MIDNFEHLAARCESLKRRRLLRLILIVAGTLVFILGVLLSYNQWIHSETPTPVVKAPATLKTESNASVSAVPVERNETNLSSVTKPPLPVNTPVAAPLQITKPLATAIKPTITPAAAPANLPVPMAKVPVTAPVPPKNNRLFDVNTQNYESPIEAYKSNPKYETALAAARDFYAKENFIEAANWAKKANQLNREAEEAWLLYAKSYYAQGRKAEAIGILELFLNYKDSKTASELIRTWKLNTTN